VTPEELLDMIENTSDFEETKVHMVNEAIDGLDLEFSHQQQSHEMPQRPQSVTGQKFVVKLPQLYKTSSELGLKIIGQSLKIGSQ
jgi:hypothetical protein